MRIGNDGRRGFVGVKNPDKAYDIEKKYGYSPEEIFTSAFYNTRPKLFFDFYKYPVEYIKQAHGIPVCEDCQIPIRPGLFFFREMADSQLVTQAVEEINRAEVLLLGTNLNSEVFSHYIKYFQGKYLVIIHQRSHYLDDNADMVFIDQPKNILSRLGYV